MAAKRRGYESAAPLRAGRAHTPPPVPLAAPTEEKDALVEYTTALEAENLELKSVGGGDVSAVRNLPNTAASATTTNTTTALIEEMKHAHRKHTQHKFSN